MAWKNQFDVFARIESMRELFKPWVPDGNSVKIRALLMRCVKFRLKQIDKLTPVESELYDFMLSHKLLPKTIYLYFLMEDVPPELKAKMQKNEMSLQKANVEFLKWKRLMQHSSAKTLLQDVKETIGRLRWKSQENTHQYPD
ncbi:MAG: hypothetical protein AABY01_00705 [Nanoarchaeota archaeon]